ncbi:Uncharacterised protein [Rhodococcus erythropolis]|nr:Uncharacterised protein [Rhodococcus erythropolis]
MATSGENYWPPTGRTSWPLTELVDDQHPNPGRSQQRDCLLFEFVDSAPRADRRSECSKHRQVEPCGCWVWRHLHTQHRYLLAIGQADSRVRTPELLDDHRLAVVRRSDQKHVRHTLPIRPHQQRLKMLDHRPCTRIPDPPFSTNMPDALRGRKNRNRSDRTSQVGEVRTNDVDVFATTVVIVAGGSVSGVVVHPFTTLRCRRRSEPARRRCLGRARAGSACPVVW